MAYNVEGRYGNAMNSVITRQNIALDNQRKQLRENRAHMMVNAAGHIDSAIQSRKLNSLMRQISEDAEAANQGRHDEVMTAFENQRRLLEKNHAEAVTQRYAQWRDGTDPGKHYHYTYRPVAQAHLANYARSMERWCAAVLIEVKRQVDSFPEWRQAHQLPDGFQTGIFLAPPDLPELTPPPSVEDKRSSYLKRGWGAAAGVFVVLLIGTYLVNNDMLSPGLAAFLNILILLALVTIPVVTKIARSRNTQELRAYREQWTHYENAVREQESIEQKWATANTHEYKQVLKELSRRVGIDLDGNWSESFATSEGRNHHAYLEKMVLNEQTNPPAVTDLIPIEQNIPINPEITG